MGKVIMSGCAANATVPKMLSTFELRNYSTSSSYTSETFNFVSGMTWKDFISSKYNTNGRFYIDKTTVMAYGMGILSNVTFNPIKFDLVAITDLILENAWYATGSYFE